MGISYVDFKRLISISQKKTAKYLSALKEAIKNCDSSMYMISLVYNMKPLGNNDPDEFAKYKDFFEEMKNDAQLKDYAIFALDAIAGRRFKTILNKIIMQIDFTSTYCWSRFCTVNC